MSKTKAGSANPMTPSVAIATGTESTAAVDTIAHDASATAFASMIADAIVADTPTAEAPAAVDPIAEARAKRQAAMRINQPEQPDAPAATAADAPKAAKEPKFVVDLALQSELRGLTRDQLIERARDKMRPVDLANSDLLRLGQTTDHTNGSDVHRSGIRSAIYSFVGSREEQMATVAEICAYMTLGAGRLYAGKFDSGYIQTARGVDTKRGMVARRQLVVVSRKTAPAADAA